MATFTARVTALSGTPSDATELGVWLSDGVIDIIRRMKIIDPAILARFASQIAVGSGTAGLSLGTGVDILDVHRNSYDSDEIYVGLRHKAADTDSLHYATAQYPKHYKLNNTLYVLPSPTSPTMAYASYISPATVVGTDETIDSFPNELYYLVALYASLQSLQAKMSDSTLPTDLSLDSPPVIEPFVSIAETLPTYSTIAEPVIPAIPADADIDFSGIGTTPVFVPASLTLTSATTLDSLAMPPAPELDYTVDKDLTDAVKATEIVLPVISLPDTPTITESDIGSVAVPLPPSDPSFTTPAITLAPAPLYTGPTKALNVTTALSTVTSQIETSEDVELASVKINEVQVAVQDFVAEINNSLNEFNDDNVVYQATLQKEIEEARLINSKESNEYAAQVQIYQAKIQAYVALINAEVQKFASNEVQYRIGIWTTQTQAAINEYNAVAGAILQKYAHNISNNSRFTESEVSIFGIELQRITAENRGALEKFSAEITSATQAWNLEELQGKQGKWIAQRSTEINKFQVDSTNAWNEYNSAFQNWVQLIRKAIETFQAETGYDLTKFTAQFQANIAEHSEKVKNESTEFSSNLEKYIADLQRITEYNGRIVNKFNSLLKSYQAKSGSDIQVFASILQKRQMQYNWYIDQYGRLKVQYEQGFVPFQIQGK